ncbi:hypothetical protein POM88_026254 [Heracleum sosnowskyi]|uniref:Transposase MuDR plant domain-containing protein n=1 Tax=Heracleum sosnowskyi TaxID=360622 RepID=A0AAD8I8R6_9APIA|nr:hypothetical protein POM88_026254 [Heracleum sosnowskyi]
MVRTRSGVEVRIPEQQNEEDEIEIEDDNVVEDDDMETVDEDQTTSEESMDRVYNVILYYGGYFVHVPFESYTSNVRKVYKHIDLENLSINDLKLCFGPAVGEFDSLYFKTPDLKIVLLNEESKSALTELSKDYGYNIVFYVYHVTPVNPDSDIERDDYGCSDDEFVEIRKACREEKKKMDEYEIKANLGETDEFEVGSESDREFYPSSEESDAKYCYANPSPENEKMKHVGEVFNVHTPAKNIKFKVGQIFGSKKDFKVVVRSISMETGYIKDKDKWQVKSVVNGCVWSYKNKLVTTKYLVDMFGDRIRKNPNWKLCEMQEEFKRVLKVNVCDAKCSRIRKAALSGVVEKMDEHYAKLRKFGGEILRSNKENTVKISTTRLQEGDGLDKAIRELLPQVEHRFCTRHLNANLKGKYPTGLVNDTCTGCTPPVSTPPTRKVQVKKNTPRKKVATSSKTVKEIAPPRKK